MVPADLHDFIGGCLGASASFIGLMYVGLSVVLQRSDGELAAQQRIQAESAYAAFVNVFFLTLLAFVPGENLGYVALVAAITGLMGCRRLLGNSRSPILAISATVYLAELLFGGLTVSRPHRDLDQNLLVPIVVALFIIGLVRAWALVGVRAQAPAPDADTEIAV